MVTRQQAECRVVRWGLADDAVLIELACSASVAGHPLSFVVVDRCVLNDDGLCTHRTTYMNPIPLAWALATRPRVAAMVAGLDPP